jgi:hypothetical protein
MMLAILLPFGPLGLGGRRGLRNVPLAGHAILEVRLPVPTHPHRSRSPVWMGNIRVSKASFGGFGARRSPRFGWRQTE